MMGATRPTLLAVTALALLHHILAANNNRNHNNNIHNNHSNNNIRSLVDQLSSDIHSFEEGFIKSSSSSSGSSGNHKANSQQQQPQKLNQESSIKLEAKPSDKGRQTIKMQGSLTFRGSSFDLQKSVTLDFPELPLVLHEQQWIGTYERSENDDYMSVKIAVDTTAPTQVVMRFDIRYLTHAEHELVFEFEIPEDTYQKVLEVRKTGDHGAIVGLEVKGKRGVGTVFDGSRVEDQSKVSLELFFSL